MPSLFGRLAGFFRADAATAPPPSVTLAPPPTQRRTDAVFNLGSGGGFANAATGVGIAGTDPRMESSYSAGWMSDELAIELWRGSALARKLVSTLPEEAIEPGFALTIQQDEQGATGAADARDSAELVEQVETKHRSLGTLQIIRRASEWERLLGGAAIWIGANDMEAGDWSQPLNLEAPALKLNWLRVLRTRELFPHRYYSDPLHPKFGKVEIWQLSSITPRMATAALPTVYIHESRLCVFHGRRIVEDGTVVTQSLHSFEFGDGILLGVVKAIRRFEEALDNVELSMRANGELIWQHERLADILAVEGGEEDFKQLVRAMDYAQSTLRARVVGAGQTLTRAGAPLNGLADIVTKFENELAAIGDMPRTKLFGESPGGLGANGENSQQDWDRSCAVYRKNHQQPAYELITALILRTLGGLPKRWKVEGNKYRELSAKEQAELTKMDADTDIAMAGAGIITVDVIQARSVWRDRYQLPDPEEQPAEVEPGGLPEDIRGGAAAGGTPPLPGAPPNEGADPAAGAPPPDAPKPADLALNGAQALALSAIVEKVAAGTMPRESGAQLVQFSFKVPPEQAEKMMPPDGYRPSAVEAGLQQAPAPAPPSAAPPVLDAAPRRDAKSAMADLIAKLAPYGRCDECGLAHPLEVDHIEGRGWDPASLSKAQRAARYWKEYEDGVPLRALCRSCNGRDGAANKQGKSGPRHRADSISLGGNVRFTYAPLPDELVAAMRALQDEVVPEEGLLQEIDHLTLVYCGKAAEDIDEEDVDEVVDELAGVAAAATPIRAKVQGWGYFDGARKDGEPKTALVALVDAPGITELQVELRDSLDDAGMEPSSEHSFSPHFTFCYLPPGGRIAELPAIAAEFVIDRICFANREVHELPLGSLDVDVDDLEDEEIEDENDVAEEEGDDPAAIAARITPYQQRALKGEDRTALVATLELLMGVPLAMAERLIPGGAPTPPPPPSTRGDSDDEAPGDDGETEERDDCANPLRQEEGGLFAGCAEGEGGDSGSGGKETPAKKGSGSSKAAGDKPAKKLTPKQKAAAKAKAVREKARAKEKAKKEKIKARAKAQREKARAKKAAAKAKEKAKKQKAKEKLKAKREKEKAKKTAKREKDRSKKATKAVKNAESASAQAAKSRAGLEEARRKLAEAKARTEESANKVAKLTGKSTEQAKNEAAAKMAAPVGEPLRRLLANGATERGTGEIVSNSFRLPEAERQFAKNVQAGMRREQEDRFDALGLTQRPRMPNSEKVQVMRQSDASELGFDAYHRTSSGEVVVSEDMAKLLTEHAKADPKEMGRQHPDIGYMTPVYAKHVLNHELIHGRGPEISGDEGPATIAEELATEVIARGITSQEHGLNVENTIGAYNYLYDGAVDLVRREGRASRQRAIRSLEKASTKLKQMKEEYVDGRDALWVIAESIAEDLEIDGADAVARIAEDLERLDAR